MLLTLGDHSKKKKKKIHPTWFCSIDQVTVFEISHFHIQKKKDPGISFTEINLKEWNIYLPKETSRKWTLKNKVWGYS